MMDADILVAAKENVALQAVAEYLDEFIPTTDTMQRRRVKRLCSSEEFTRQDPQQHYPVEWER